MDREAIESYTEFGDLVQQNTLSDLADLSPFIPKMTVRELIEYTGNKGVGLGTLMNDKGVVVGEVTVIDGKGYFSSTDFNNKNGNTRELDPNEMVYFAQVGFFESETLQKFNISKNDEYIKSDSIFKANGGKITKEILQNYISDIILKHNPEKAAGGGAYVIKMTDAKFDYIRLRSVDGSQEYQFGEESRKPKNLKEVIGNQVEKEFVGVAENFTLAGIFNDMSKGKVSTGESPEGLHMHAIDKDRKSGGHVQVQDIDLNSSTIQVMPVQKWLIATKDHAGKLGFRIAKHPDTEIKIHEARDAAIAFNSAGYGLGKK